MTVKQKTQKISKKTPNKTTVKNAVATHTVSRVRVSATNGARLKKLTKRQDKKVEKKSQRSVQMPSAWAILGQSLRHIYRNKKLFGGILLTYGLLYVLFVKGISANFQLGNLRENLSETFNGKMNGLSTGVALYGLLLGTAGSSSNDTGGAYQTALVIIISLALIWALRVTYGKDAKPRIRDSFYKGMYPLVPFIVVALVIVVQMLPALITASLFSVIQNNGLAVGPFQSAVVYVILAAGLFWSLYMLSSSLFALYIVTLPDTAPFAALKSARKLIKYKRALLIRKVLFLPVSLLVFSALVLIPLILLIPIAAEVLFMLFTILLLGVVHSYLYTLYRSLL